MKQRLSVNSRAELVARDGTVVGRLESMTIDVAVGVRGVKADNSTTISEATSSNAQETLLPDGGAGEDSTSDVAKVWAHYQAVVSSGERYKIDAKRRSIIRNALKVRPLEIVLRAIDGLAVSPYHNGHNNRRKKYLGIHYALQGLGPESNDERIDKAASWATPTSSDLLATIPSAAHAMVRTRQRLVEDMLKHPTDENRRTRAGNSERYLREQWHLRPLIGEAGPDGLPTITWERET